VDTTKTGQEQILEYMAGRKPYAAHFRDVAKALGLKDATVGTVLATLAKDGTLERADAGVYFMPDLPPEKDADTPPMGVVDYMQNSPKPEHHPNDIAKALAVRPELVIAILSNMAENGQAKRIGAGFYRLSKPGKPAPEKSHSDQILGYLSDSRRKGTSIHYKHIAEDLGLPVGAVSSALSVLVNKRGKVDRTEAGMYRWRDPNAAD